MLARRGMLGTVATIAREEGATSLWKGLEPGASAWRYNDARAKGSWGCCTYLCEGAE